MDNTFWILAIAGKLLIAFTMIIGLIIFSRRLIKKGYFVKVQLSKRERLLNSATAMCTMVLPLLLLGVIARHPYFLFVAAILGTSTYFQKSGYKRSR